MTGNPINRKGKISISPRSTILGKLKGDAVKKGRRDPRSFERGGGGDLQCDAKKRGELLHRKREGKRKELEKRGRKGRRRKVKERGWFPQLTSQGKSLNQTKDGQSSTSSTR